MKLREIIGVSFWHTCATGQMKSGANSTDEGGTGIKGSAEGKGATDSQINRNSTKPMGSESGMSTGNAPGGTGVEQSTEGQGSTNKTKEWSAASV